MDKFILKNKIQLSVACQTLKDAPKSTKDKEDTVKAIQQSHFCNPPKARVIQDIGKYSELIELTFYLKMILDSDYLAHQILTPAPYQNPQDPWVTVRKDTISQIPGQANYPKYSYFEKSLQYTEN